MNAQGTAVVRASLCQAGDGAGRDIRDAARARGIGGGRGTLGVSAKGGEEDGEGEGANGEHRDGGDRGRERWGMRSKAS